MPQKEPLKTPKIRLRSDRAATDDTTTTDADDSRTSANT